MVLCCDRSASTRVHSGPWQVTELKSVYFHGLEIDLSKTFGSWKFPNMIEMLSGELAVQFVKNPNIECRSLLFFGIIYCYKSFGDFAIFDWWRYCKAICDVKFRQIEGNGWKFRHIELMMYSASTSTAQPLFPASSKRHHVFPPHQSITHGFLAV